MWCRCHAPLSEGCATSPWFPRLPTGSSPGGQCSQQGGDRMIDATASHLNVEETAEVTTVSLNVLCYMILR